MKLIIDVPDEVLETKHYCQYFGAWSTKLTETIENGTPYNPSGDLISREALKTAIEDHFDNLDAYFPSAFIKEIDNAPPVLAYTEDDMNGATVDGYDVAKRQYERPQDNQIAWKKGYECGYHQAKEDIAKRIKDQYNEHHELIPYWLSIGDVKGGVE